MPRGTHRRLFAFAVLILLLVMPFFLAALPGRSGQQTTDSFIVKRGTNIGTIAQSLRDDGYVRSKYLFLFVSFLAHKGRVVAGEYELSKSMSIFQIARKMALGQRKIYVLKIVEGYNLHTIADAVQRSGIMEAQAFLELARKPELLERLAIPSDSLEGYLCPDTYFYSREVDFDEFLARIVSRTFRLFEKQDVRQRMEELNMNLFQTLNLASIIEKEAKREEEKELVSAVFHNRLRIGMSLDADPTVIYGRGSFDRQTHENRSRHAHGLQYLSSEGAAQRAYLQSFEKLHHGGALSGPERRPLFCFKE